MPASITQRPAWVCRALSAPLRMSRRTSSSPDSSPTWMRVNPASDRRFKSAGPFWWMYWDDPYTVIRSRWGKDPAGMGADLCQPVGAHGDGIAGRKKKGADPVPMDLACLVQVAADPGHGAFPVARPVFIDHAEGAPVPRAAHGCLDQQRIRLAGGGGIWGLRSAIKVSPSATGDRVSGNHQVCQCREKAEKTGRCRHCPRNLTSSGFKDAGCRPSPSVADVRDFFANSSDLWYQIQNGLATVLMLPQF